MALFSRKSSGPVKVSPIGMHWDTEDPFIFASHHEDDYPHGNRQQAPPLEEIRGRDLGRDYEMRFGFGDVQWVSASSRYEHNEMYPLTEQEGRNPNDITQIFVNLPLELKNRENTVTTVWREEIPVVEGDGWTAKVICGSFDGRRAYSPSRNTWADGEHGVRIIRFSVEPGSSLTIDPARDGANRNLYLITPGSATVMGTDVKGSSRVKVLKNRDVDIVNGPEHSVIWLLEGVPINQKMSMYGPVCLETLAEVRAGLDEIRRREYHEWPWQYVDQAQPLGTERYIRYPDGTESRPN